MDRRATGDRNGGLFTYLDENAAVKRLGLLSTNITVGTPGQSVSTRYVGGLVGHNKGTIADCYVTGSVTNSVGHTGGLTAMNSGVITGSYAAVAVTANIKDKDKSFYVGYNTGGLAGMNYGTISGSHATGDVISNVMGSKVVPTVGGLVGSNVSAITASYATGNVTSNVSGNETVRWSGWFYWAQCRRINHLQLRYW